MKIFDPFSYCECRYLINGFLSAQFPPMRHYFPRWKQDGHWRGKNYNGDTTFYSIPASVWNCWIFPKWPISKYSKYSKLMNIFPIGTRAQAKKVATTEFAAAEKKSENGKFLIKVIKDKEGVLKLETIPLVLMKWFQKWKVLWRFCKTRFSW